MGLEKTGLSSEVVLISSGHNSEILLYMNKDVNVYFRSCNFHLPYFFDYKMVFFSFQNNPKNLDPSYKTDLDLWDCLGRVKPVLQQNFIGLIRLFVLILERESPVLQPNKYGDFRIFTPEAQWNKTITCTSWHQVSPSWMSVLSN